MSSLCEQISSSSFRFDCKGSELFFQIVKTDQSSKDNLLKLFNAAENPVACKDYGNGKYCAETRVDTKVKIWGGRGEDKDELFCATARIISIDKEPIAMFNIGITGSSPTVVDKSGIGAGKIGFITAPDDFANPMVYQVGDEPNQQVAFAFSALSTKVLGIQEVHEFSGLFMSDALALNFDLKGKVSESARVYMKECIADEGYSKAIFTSSSENQIDFMLDSGGIKLTPDNIDGLLGKNSMYPERFKFENGQFLECENWDQSQEKVYHESWHGSEPCVEWKQKEMIVFDVKNGHIQVHDEI